MGMKAHVSILASMLLLFHSGHLYAASINGANKNVISNTVEDDSSSSRVRPESESQAKNNILPSEEYKIFDEPPCKIFQTTFGCCWDNRTIAEGPNGYGCPVCADEDKHYCKWIARKLNICYLPIVKTRCPVTCQLPCATNCKDDGSTKFCKFLKRKGLCHHILKDHGDELFIHYVKSAS
eukprot:gene13949-15405_t